MNNREKIVEDLRDFVSDLSPFAGNRFDWMKVHAAIKYLKEPVKPEKESSGVTWWNVCGNCRTAINPNDKYCHECGRAVKWDA